jgi:ribonucleoside-diphosphate reductase alpha chain
VAFVAEELKAVFDPEGGRWMGGRYVPSLLAAIGDVIEEHMLRTGFLTRNEPLGSGEEASERRPIAVEQRPGSERIAARVNEPAGGAVQSVAPLAGARICPRCGERALRHVEGCWTCASCAYSRCG